MLTKLTKPLFYSLKNKNKIKLFSHNKDIWISINEMSKLLDMDYKILGQYLKEIIEKGDLSDILLCEKFIEITNDKEQKEDYFYNLDMILSVAYDLNRKKSLEFKVWIEEISKDIIIKGFSIDDEEIKKYKNTPLDYTDNRIWIYFEFGGKQDLTTEYMLKIIGPIIDKNKITEAKYGFNLLICNQHIPDIARMLIQENKAIYQIARIKGRQIIK